MFTIMINACYLHHSRDNKNECKFLYKCYLEYTRFRKVNTLRIQNFHILKTLHWLPVRQRIVFKILLIVFKALNGQAPSYILELLTLKSNSHSHNLRSSNDTLLLKMPTCKTKVTLGDRAFSCAAPKIWNNLPLSIRKSQSVTSFKTKLKTHLFVQAFQ